MRYRQNMLSLSSRIIANTETGISSLVLASPCYFIPLDSGIEQIVVFSEHDGHGCRWIRGASRVRPMPRPFPRYVLLAIARDVAHAGGWRGPPLRDRS